MFPSHDPEATSQLGTATVDAEAKVSVTGLELTSAVGTVLIWGEVDDDQTPNWSEINDGVSDGWSTIDDSQTPNWDEIAA